MSALIRGTIEEEFAEFFLDTAVIEPFVKHTGYGDIVYGPPGQTWDARIEGGVKRVTTPDGETKMSAKTVFIFGAPEVRYNDRITLSDGTVSSVLQVDEERDDQGIHHVVIFV